MVYLSSEIYWLIIMVQKSRDFDPYALTHSADLAVFDLM